MSWWFRFFQRTPDHPAAPQGKLSTLTATQFAARAFTMAGVGAFSPTSAAINERAFTSAGTGATGPVAATLGSTAFAMAGVGAFSPIGALIDPRSLTSTQDIQLPVNVVLAEQAMRDPRGRMKSPGAMTRSMMSRIFRE